MAAAGGCAAGAGGLWRQAKDPWQFLQLCRAIQQQVEDPSSACRVPVRFDQTCSGVGHRRGLDA
jgi:DNA-directed RNA polymerase